MLNNWLLSLCIFLGALCVLAVQFFPKQKPPSSAGLDGGSLTSFVAQRSYPDLGLGFLLCFFCLLSNVCICSSLVFLCISAVQSATKNPPVRAGSFALLMLSKPKIPDLDRALLLGFLGERYTNHFSSFTDNGNEFNALAVTFQCAKCLNFIGKKHKIHL